MTSSGPSSSAPSIHAPSVSTASVSSAPDPSRAGLAGRTALVTGSSSGIGAAIARALAVAGAHVLVSGRDTARSLEVVESIRSGGGRADFLAVDLACSYAGIRDFARDALAAVGGRLDILVNNAGVYTATSTQDLPDADLDAMLAVNVRAPHVLVGAIAPAMAERGNGVIVNIGSWMARVGSPFALDVDGGISATRLS